MAASTTPTSFSMFSGNVLNDIDIICVGLDIAARGEDVRDEDPWNLIHQTAHFITRFHYSRGGDFECDAQPQPVQPNAQNSRQSRQQRQPIPDSAIRTVHRSTTWSSLTSGDQQQFVRKLTTMPLDRFVSICTDLNGEIQAMITRLAEGDDLDEEVYRPKLMSARAMITGCKKAVMQGRYMIACRRLGPMTGFSVGYGFDASPLDDGEQTDHNVMFSFVMDTFLECGFRKHKGSVMRPVYTSEGAHTRTFEPAGLIADVVCEVLSVDSDHGMHRLAIKRNQYEGVIKAVTRIPDKRFSGISPIAGIYTFDHTALDVRDPRDPVIVGIDELRSDIVAMKYFKDNDVERSWLDTPDFMDIPTPFFNSIFDYQDIPEDAQRYIFAVLGRCLYPLNSYDNWQVIPFFRGKAGTGKSTLLESVIAKMFHKDDVVFLADECQSFSLAPAINRRLWIVPEVTAKFKLSQADFQQLVSGGAVEVRIKHKDSVIINNWDIPGIMAGNQLPLSMSNNSGSLTRRFNVIPFNTSVPESRRDTQLADKLMSEMPAIITKLTRAYGTMLNRVGATSLRSHMPAFLSNVMEEVSCAFSPLMSFVVTSGKVLFMEDHYVPEQFFLDAFNSYCRSINVEPPHWNSDLYDDVFCQNRIRVERAGPTRRSWNLQSVRSTDKVFVGIELAINTE
jgi:hypothetical protein